MFKQDQNSNVKEQRFHNQTRTTTTAELQESLLTANQGKDKTEKSKVRAMELSIAVKSNSERREKDGCSREDQRNIAAQLSHG